MFIKVCIAGAVAFGLIVTIPIASFAAGDNDKSASSAKGTVHHKKLKKGFSDTFTKTPAIPPATTAPSHQPTPSRVSSMATWTLRAMASVPG